MWLFQAIDSQILCLPPPEELPGAMGPGPVDFHLIGGEAFPQKVYLQKL